MKIERTAKMEVNVRELLEKTEVQGAVEAVNKVQWAFGETIFRIQKLLAILEKKGCPPRLKQELSMLLKTVKQIEQLYRHDIAEKVKPFLS